MGEAHDIWGAGIAQWLERRTRDWKAAGSNPCWSGGRIFFSRVDLLYWLLFRYPFHPRVTAVTRKKSRPFCQKCRWQVTAKHAYTFRMWLCMRWHGAWLYDVHIMRRDGSSFMYMTWHRPCQRCNYTTSVDIQKRSYEKLVTHVLRITCERSESARERRTALYRSNHHQHRDIGSQWKEQGTNRRNIMSPTPLNNNLPVGFYGRLLASKCMPPTAWTATGWNTTGLTAAFGFTKRPQ